MRDAKGLGPRLDGPVGGAGVDAVHPRHAPRQVADGDLEEPRLGVGELVDDAGPDGRDEYRDLVRMVAGPLAQLGLDPRCVPVERLAL